MPHTTGYDVGDVVLVPSPFTDQTGVKKRPALVVSTKPYQDQRRDLVTLAITSQIRPPLGFGEFIVADWKSAGLLKPSVVKPVFATIEKRLVIRALGQITDPDRQALATVLRTVFGA